jgi:capsular exopolysaccharide synthesis family protein
MDEQTISSLDSDQIVDTDPASAHAVGRPALESASSPSNVGHESPWHDYCRVLLHRLDQWKPNTGTTHTLGIISCSNGAGVTSLVSHLGSTTAADTQRSVLLIDANLDAPLLERLFGLPAGPGLSDLLLGRAAPGDVIRHTKVERLDVVSAGNRSVSSTRALSSANLPAVLDALKRDYELVLVDLPALDGNPAAAWVAGLLDGVILVVESERDATEAAQHAQDLLIQSHARMLGVVLNKRAKQEPSWMHGKS